MDLIPPLSDTSFQRRALIQDADGFSQDIPDLAQGVHAYIWQYHRTAWLTALIASSLLFIAGGAAIIVYLQPINDPRIFILPGLFFLWPAHLYAHYRSKIQHLFFEQIAETLNLTYTEKGDVATIGALMLNPAMGHDKKMEDVLTGTYHEFPLRIYTYTLTVGYGKGSHTDTYTVFEIMVDKSLPEIRLTPGLGGIPAPNETAVQLEGDFSKYFTLVAPKDYETDIRVIFAPDLMANLIDHYRAYRMEIYKNKIYVIAPPITKQPDFLQAHDLIDALFDKMIPSLEAVGTVSDVLEPTPAQNAPVSVFSETQL